MRHLSLFWYPIESTLQENDCHISSSIQLRRSFSKCLKGFSLIHVRGLHKSLSFGYTVETLSNHEGHIIGLPSSFLQNVWPNYQVALTPRCQVTQCRHLPARSCHSLWLQEVPTWFFPPFTSQDNSILPEESKTFTHQLKVVPVQDNHLIATTWPSCVPTATPLWSWFFWGWFTLHYWPTEHLRNKFQKFVVIIQWALVSRLHWYWDCPVLSFFETLFSPNRFGELFNAVDPNMLISLTLSWFTTWHLEES